MLELEKNWAEVLRTLNSAVSIAWDECHKIYILMDEDQHEKMKGYGYKVLIRVDSIGAGRAYTLLRLWWEESCWLRFINAVHTVEGDPNDGYVSLIEQFEDCDEEDWEDD